MRSNSLVDCVPCERTPFYCSSIHSSRVMKQASVSQQMYVNWGQFIINKAPDKLSDELPSIVHFILPFLVGSLLCDVPLASLLTLYLSNPCCADETTTTAVTTQTNPVQTTYYCAGVSPSTLWHAYSTSGITMNVSTSNCNFSSIPVYFTSMAGATFHWVLGGYTAIYSPTSTSFTILANSVAGWNSTQLLTNAHTWAWSVNWFGVSN